MKLSLNYKNKDAFQTVSPNEVIILSHLPTRWKYIARDRDRTLVIYSKKPWKGSKTWKVGAPNTFMVLPYTSLFKCVKWSDDQPTSIDKLIRNNIEGLDWKDEL